MNLEGQAHGEVDSSMALNDTMGLLSPPKEDEMHGVVNIEPTVIYLKDDIVPIPCEDESHISHLSESKSEMRGSTICEIECSHFERKSDTPHELSEDILLSNNLTSTPLVLYSYLLGCSDKDDILSMEM
jgi:hypothetical protein